MFRTFFQSIQSFTQRTFFVACCGAAFLSGAYDFNEPVSAQEPASVRDLYSDTWVGTDALGRKMPTHDDVGDLKDDQPRCVGMFYITWHTQDYFNWKAPYIGNVTKVLQTDPGARFDANNPMWDYPMHHWGEPEMGYFLSQDEYVIRKDMSMLADAGVDVLILDVTNAAMYWDEWEKLFQTMESMKAEGNSIPQFCFWAFNGPAITVVQNLYDAYYKEGKYKDLWFIWDDKPLLLYNNTPRDATGNPDIKHHNPHYDPAASTDPNHPHFGDSDYADEFYSDYTKEVKEFFTLRTMWWGYYKWAGKRFIGTEDNWSFGYDMGDNRVQQLTPEELLSTHNGIREEAAVTPAQHPSSGIGKSWRKETGEPALNEYDLPAEAFVPWLGKTVTNPEAYGIYFQDRWEEALPVNPQFLYLNDWNEWTAMIFKNALESAKMDFMNRSLKAQYYFVDQYNSEFNRCMQPMRGGYTDNYYMQMAQNIRRYKGARPLPKQKGVAHFDTKSQEAFFDSWNEIEPEYRDTAGDVFHRDSKGYAGLHYTDTTGRNDIITAKVAAFADNVWFFVQCAQPLTSHEDRNWMLLLIDADQNSETGWFGYDFVINKKVISPTETTLMTPDKNGDWQEVSRVKYCYQGDKMVIAIPRKALGLEGDEFGIDFKWSDNSGYETDGVLIDPISLCTSGDTAPNRRFNYRFQWEKIFFAKP